MPIIVELGYDPVWFGILFAVSMQVSYISPPFGPAAFYLKSVAPTDITLTDIFRSMVPFIVIQIAVLGLLLYFPAILTWLL
ncbi:TRAP transporter large permease subunit [Stutzerimonas stutzeri]|nr:TRAP transporter large permease subunit [Stutzerimonas stutzeri]MCQ4331249.1 TRAP transporter large permease subunit [Stutzerimonas stutzeri]